MDQFEIAKNMIEAKIALDAAILAYEEAIRADADADDRERRAKARAYVEVREELENLGPRPTVAHIEALVDERTSELQKKARLAEGYKRAAAMRVDAEKQWLSNLQSLAAAARVEAELLRYGPRETDAA